MANVERRSNARRLVSRPAKLRCIHTGRYMTGQTRDVSSSGALLEVDQPLSILATGQNLEIGVAWNHQQVLLHSDHLTKATVMRIMHIGEIQRVAIRFDRPLELAMSA